MVDPEAHLLEPVLECTVMPDDGLRDEREFAACGGRLRLPGSRRQAAVLLRADFRIRGISFGCLFGRGDSAQGKFFEPDRRGPGHRFPEFSFTKENVYRARPRRTHVAHAVETLCESG